MHASFLIIGGGLSGLAAAIRLARFNQNVLLLERHSRPGGLNSYYFRKNHLFETGLHAITNFAPRKDKKAPLNRLLRQLKIDRNFLNIREQIRSEIHFPGKCTLSFSNDFDELCTEISANFNKESDRFLNLVSYIDTVDPFEVTPYRSTRKVLSEHLFDPLLINMLLCPILYYGSSWENDIDFNQFVIMFRAIFKEGMFRPEGSIKDLLDLLLKQYEDFGGELRFKSGVKNIIHKNNKASGVILTNGQEITCDYLISTAGLDETKKLLGIPKSQHQSNRLSFTENIFQLDFTAPKSQPSDTTIIFFNTSEEFTFEKPETMVDFNSGVLCMPYNFQNCSRPDHLFEIRTTHLANYDLWNRISSDRKTYNEQKRASRLKSYNVAEKIIGPFSNQIIFMDSFTPITIEKFTGKIEGAIYGSPNKVKSGDIGFDNLFIAGTDQGFLGIVGSMLSGVSVVNQNILTKI